MKRALLISFVLATAVHAAITNVRVIGTTNTQATIAYTAPDLTACTWEVSTSPTYSPLAHDVDTSLFSGSNLDSRAGSITNGRARQFIAGTRTAQAASDGTGPYSRA